MLLSNSEIYPTDQFSSSEILVILRVEMAEVDLKGLHQTRRYILNKLRIKNMRVIVINYHDCERIEKKTDEELANPPAFTID